MTWREIAAAQSGVITRAQLRTAGISDRTVTRMLARGVLTRVNSGGVYSVGGAGWSADAQLWAAVLMAKGVLGFATAASIWGMETQAPAHVNVVVEGARRPRVESWVRIHRG